MRFTERKIIYPKCDEQGNLTEVNYIEIKNKELAEEKLCDLEDAEEEYCITDTKDLRKRLDLADKYMELSEKLGIDLITFFKALKDGAFIKLNDGRIIEGFSPTTQEFPVYIYFTVWGEDVNSDYDLDEKGVYTKDYGKTWALTKEELC